MSRLRRRCALFLVPLLSALAVFPTAAIAAFPGKPGKIAFVRVNIREGDDTGGIFVHGPRLNQPAKQLTADPEDREPSFSADGRKLAFVGNRSPEGRADTHIYLLTLKDRRVRQLTSGKERDSSPAFSPDGKRIVFSRVTGPGLHADLFSIAVDGSGLRQLTKGPNSDTEPTYTLNGRAIVFVSDRDPDSRPDRSDIFSIRPDGSRLRELVDGPRRDDEPDVRPMGAASPSRATATTVPTSSSPPCSAGTRGWSPTAAATASVAPAT